MTITCENGTPIEAVEDYGILPSDITAEEYIILDDCCKYGTEGFYESIVMGTAVSGMAPGETQEVTISGGCAPFKWIAESPMSFTEFYTVSGTNTLYLHPDAEPLNAATTLTITDLCYTQGSPASEPIVSDVAVAKETATGNPWALVFIANTSDCYTPGTTSEIDLIVPYEITQVVVTNAGCSSTGLNPVQLTTPAGYSTTVSLSITMKANGYEWANGDPVYGTTVMSVSKCCGEGDITYTTQQMEVDEQQTLGFSGTWNQYCHSWEITSGGGSLGAVAANGDVVYTAPSSNPECDNNPVISLISGGMVIDTISIAINAVSGAAYEIQLACCECVGDGGEWSTCSPGTYCNAQGRSICVGGFTDRYYCNGVKYQTAGMSGCVAFNCAQCGYPPNPVYPNGCYAPPITNDTRTAQQKTDGCCPAGLL